MQHPGLQQDQRLALQKGFLVIINKADYAHEILLLVFLFLELDESMAFVTHKYNFWQGLEI